MKLKDHNRFNLERIDGNKYHLADVECDACDAAMMYVDDAILCNDPPQRRVMCTKCKYEGYKII